MRFYLRWISGGCSGQARKNVRVASIEIQSNLVESFGFHRGLTVFQRFTSSPAESLVYDAISNGFASRGENAATSTVDPGVETSDKRILCPCLSTMETIRAWGLLYG